jgi:hypothetical protein
MSDCPTFIYLAWADDKLSLSTPSYSAHVIASKKHRGKSIFNSRAIPRASQKYLLFDTRKPSCAPSAEAANRREKRKFFRARYCAIRESNFGRRLTRTIKRRRLRSPTATETSHRFFFSTRQRHRFFSTRQRYRFSSSPGCLGAAAERPVSEASDRAPIGRFMPNFVLAATGSPLALTTWRNWWRTRSTRQRGASAARGVTW